MKKKKKFKREKQKNANRLVVYMYRFVVFFFCRCQNNQFSLKRRAKKSRETSLTREFNIYQQVSSTTITDQWWD